MEKLLAAIMLMTTFTVWAGAYEDGQAAYEREEFATAVAKFKTAAEQGNARAQSMLGVMYRLGKGVESDYAKSERWYKMAVEQGDVGAQNNLASLYSDEEYGMQNYTEAARLFKLSAAQGNAYAQFKLGEMYSLGQGLAQNYMRAHMWLNLAVSQGFTYQAETRDEIAKNMTPQHVVDAQNLATECQERNFKNC